jgi:hypothetical protein
MREAAMVKTRTPWIMITLFFLLTAGTLWMVPGNARAGEEKAAATAIELPGEFVDRHLSAFKKRLAALKSSYQDCCGSVFAALSPGGASEIAKTLPQPTAIRLRFEYPVPEEKEEQTATITPGDYFVGNLSNSLEIQPVFSIGNFYDEERSEGAIVSADEVTSELIAKPNKINTRIRGSLQYITDTRNDTNTYCCIASKMQGGSKSCTSYARLPYRGYVYDADIASYASKIAMSQVISPGVRSIKAFRTYSFSTPGTKKITFRSNRRFGSEREHTVYRSCIPDLSYYSYSYYGYYGSRYELKEAIMGYKPAGDIEAGFKFRAVTFKKFGFPGYDIDAQYGKAIDLDFFVDVKNIGRQSYYAGHLGKIQPAVLLDFGDAGGLKAVPADELDVPVTWTTITQGPIFVNNGNLSYAGGFGATRFRAALGGQQTVERDLTVNAVDVISETIPDIRANGIIATGKDHKIVVQVKGGADMTMFQVIWASDVGSWGSPSTPFRKTGGEWRSENTFAIPLEYYFSDTKKSKLKIEAKIVRTSDNAGVYAFENSRLIPGRPAASKLALYMWNGKGFEPVSAPVDLFVPGSLSYVVFAPHVTLRDGNVYPLQEIKTAASYEATSSDPSVVGLLRGSMDADAGPGAIYAYPLENSGSTKVSARIGGADLDPGYTAQSTGDKREVESDPVVIRVNQVFSFAERSGGTTEFKLIVAGPTDMTGYRAVWMGEGRRTTSFQKAENGFMSTLSTTLKMGKVQIVKGEQPVAELNVGTATRGASIKLLPPKPPVMQVTESALPDAGSLETITECKKNVTSWVNLFGFDPQGPIEEYCKSAREREKDSIKTQRQEQKELNQLVRELKRQGQELVILGDTMQVGAAIKGDLAGLGDSAFCVWSLINGGGLKLASEITTIERVSDTEGGCFNQVSGLKSGFNPGAGIKASVVYMQKTGLPQVTTGGRVVQTTW